MARASSKPKALYAQCMAEYGYKNFEAFLTEITRFLNSIHVNPYPIYASIVSEASDPERLQFLTCIMSINDPAPRREYLGEVLRLNLPGAVELLIQMAKNNQFPGSDIQDLIDTRKTCLNTLREVNPAAALELLCEPNMHQELGTSSLNRHISQLTAVNNSYLITLLNLATIQNVLTADHLDNFLEQALTLKLRGAAKLLDQSTILQKLPAADWIARVQQARNSDSDGIRQEVEEIFSRIFPAITGRASMAQAPTDIKSRRATTYGVSLEGLMQPFSRTARSLNRMPGTPIL